VIHDCDDYRELAYSLASNIRGKVLYKRAPGVPAVVKQTVSLRVVGSNPLVYGHEALMLRPQTTVCFNDIDEAKNHLTHQQLYLLCPATLERSDSNYMSSYHSEVAGGLTSEPETTC